MFRRRLREESGYTLVEVMVSIMILAIAILPMVGMLDMAINSATVGSNYEKARALANLKMEEAKSLPYADVANDFPEAGITTPYDGGAWFTEPGDAFANLEYSVEKHYMPEPPEDPESPSFFGPPSDSATSLIRVTITVRWDDGKTYTTYGLVSA